MTETVYLNSEGDVIAKAHEHEGRNTMSLSDFQATDPSATTRIAGAPNGIIIKSDAMLAGFHRKVSGDGTRIEDYDSIEELTKQKDQRIRDIDERTVALINQGFSFAGKVFSLSMAAQANLTGTHGLKDDPAFEYPVEWNTLDNGEPHELADADAFHAFYLVAVGTKRSHLDSGTAKRNLIRDALTQIALDAVVDDR